MVGKPETERAEQVSTGGELGGERKMENNQIENVISDLQTRPIEKETEEFLKEIQERIHSVCRTMDSIDKYVTVLKADYLKKFNQTASCGKCDFDDIYKIATDYLHHP